MSTQSLYRWGAATTIGAALLLVAAAIALVVVPDGGLANPVAPTLFYTSLILTAPAYFTIYTAQAPAAGKLGFAGFVMSLIGSIMYSGPVFVLMAGTSGVATWHDTWGYAMGNVLPLGASLFLIGSTMFGIATRRAGVFSRQAGLLLAVGSFLWLVAFYVAPFLLPIANLLNAAALFWLGIGLLPRAQEGPVGVRQAAGNWNP